jgi:diphosphomevalonate decarboxylase
MLKALVKAPSNIALIKYMGKKDSSLNLPENASLSLTLDALCTLVEVSRSSGAGAHRWVSEKPQGDFPSAQTPALSEKGVAKFMRHAERVERACAEIFPRFGLKTSPGGTLTFKTANTFPAGAGIASSASAFAGLTLATALASASEPEFFVRAFSDEKSLKRELADLSRQGSGSSCRSFEGPWVQWTEAHATAVEGTHFPELAHFVILISKEEKKVSSSDAHHEVKTSPLWNGRVARVAERFRKVGDGLRSGDFKTVATTVWSESWEMHSLFHTCRVPFSYWQPGSIDALQWLSPFVQGENPPIVTMDAGPNVHLMVPRAQRDEWRERITAKFGAANFLEDRGGSGAEILKMERL